MAKTYDISPTKVNLIYASTAIGYLILAIPTNWFIENKGVRVTIIISSIFNIIGICMRCLIKIDFWFVIIGSFIASFGRACSTHSPPKVAIKWFFPSNTVLVNSILLIAAPFGYIFGYSMTNFFVTTSGEYTID